MLLASAGGAGARLCVIGSQGGRDGVLYAGKRKDRGFKCVMPVTKKRRLLIGCERDVKELEKDEHKVNMPVDMSIAAELEKEVIELTEELLTTARQNEATQLSTDQSAGGTTSLSQFFPISTKVQAVWSEDGEWYDATVEGHTLIGYFVAYDGWGNNEEVDPANVRLKEEGEVDALQEAEKMAVATREAIKRKIQQAAVTTFQPPPLPTKLQIDPNDPNEVVSTKAFHCCMVVNRVNCELFLSIA